MGDLGKIQDERAKAFLEQEGAFHDDLANTDAFLGSGVPRQCRSKLAELCEGFVMPTSD